MVGVSLAPQRAAKPKSVSRMRGGLAMSSSRLSSFRSLPCGSIRVDARRESNANIKLQHKSGWHKHGNQPLRTVLHTLTGKRLKTCQEGRRAVTRMHLCAM